MSLKFISHFQRHLYAELKNAPLVANRLLAIYLAIQQDAKYPFALLSLNHVTNESKFNAKLYQIEFDISLYSRDKSQEQLLYLADEITLILAHNIKPLADYEITSLRHISASWERGHDLITNKLTLAYQAFLQCF